MSASYIQLFFLSDTPKSSNMKSKAAKCDEAKIPSKKDSERCAASTRPDVIPKSPATHSLQNKKGDWAFFMMDVVRVSSAILLNIVNIVGLGVAAQRIGFSLHPSHGVLWFSHLSSKHSDGWIREIRR